MDKWRRWRNAAPFMSYLNHANQNICHFQQQAFGSMIAQACIAGNRIYGSHLIAQHIAAGLLDPTNRYMKW